MVSPIVIGGPTGSGKSDYALKLAQEISGEIICADSRQIFVGMKIGTASPTDEECTLVPHHNYNFVDPNKTYDAGNFIADTDQKVGEVLARGNVPIIVGGTGMYLRSWYFGLSDVPGKDEELRAQIKKRMDSEGLEAIYEELVTIDETSALRIGPSDAFRIVRALEIYKMTGKRPSELRLSHLSEPRQTAEWRLLAPDKENLNQRLHQRTQKMFSQGLIEEAIKLRGMVSPDNRLLQTIGYQESLQHVDGVLTLEEAIERTFIRTRQYAKRQMTWFNKEVYWTRIRSS